MSLSDKFSASPKGIVLSPIGIDAVVRELVGGGRFGRVGGRRLNSKPNKIWGWGGL